MSYDPATCNLCNAPEPDGDPDGTLCQRCFLALGGNEGEDFVDHDCERGRE